MSLCLSFFFFFNDTATTEIYTLSLHDALPILRPAPRAGVAQGAGLVPRGIPPPDRARCARGVSRKAKRLLPDGDHVLRSEEHTSELQSQSNLVCRLLLEKKKRKRVLKIRRGTN